MKEILHERIPQLRDPDIKDRRILRELFRDGRVLFSTIAKRAGMSKEVVNYRVKSMLKRRLLLRVNTVINVRKLGWETYFAYVHFRSTNIEKEQEIIEEFTKHPNIAWSVKCIGKYDFILKFIVKNPREIDLFLKRIEKQFEIYIDEYVIDFIEEEHPIPLSFLYDVKERPLETPKETEGFRATSTDLAILRELSEDARTSLVSIAGKLNISRETVKQHIKKMERNNVIIAYRPSAWVGGKSLGYSWYFVTLKLKKLSSAMERALMDYIAGHSNVTYYYKTIGSSDLQFEIRLKSSDFLNEVLMNIRGILKDKLKSHNLSIILEEHKYTYFPNCMIEEHV